MSGYVIAFKNVLREPFTNSTNGSFVGKFLDPQRTECSIICGSPVLSAGGVLNPILNTLLLSSFSIKKILPIFTNLKYDDLEVGNGNEAMYVYSILEELTPKERIEKYDALKIYCRQDTWSMVEILWALKKVI